MEGSKRTMEVIIDGKVYTMAGDESEEYMQRIASLVNNKIQELKTMPSYKKLNKDFQGILLALNLSDDLCKMKEAYQAMKEECEKKDKEIYDKNQEILTAKMQFEASQKLTGEYKNKIDEMQKKMIHLQTGGK